MDNRSEGRNVRWPLLAKIVAWLELLIAIGTTIYVIFEIKDAADRAKFLKYYYKSSLSGGTIAILALAVFDALAELFSSAILIWTTQTEREGWQPTQASRMCAVWCGITVIVEVIHVVNLIVEFYHWSYNVTLLILHGIFLFIVYQFRSAIERNTQNQNPPEAQPVIA